MIVACPACGTKYNLTPAQIGAGRTVRCIKCEHSWFQAAEGAPAETPPLPPENPVAGEKSATPPRPARSLSRKWVIILGAALILGIFFFATALLIVDQTEPENEKPALSPTAVTSADGLAIDNVERTITGEGTDTILVFTGTVTNTSHRTKKIPEIRVTLKDAQGESLDAWAAIAEKDTLASGETTRWVCRFFNPRLEKVSSYAADFVKNN